MVVVVAFALPACLNPGPASEELRDGRQRGPDDNPDGPNPIPTETDGGNNDPIGPGPDPADDPPPGNLVARVLELAQRDDARAMAPAPTVSPQLFELGQFLAFDKVLSGNGDISCMTCHHPTLGTADARSLSIGVGGAGLGMDRSHPEDVRIPRNAPPLFNLHAQPTMFWDNRVAEQRGGIETPAGAEIDAQMRATFDFGAASAQAMFPVTSREEMRGAPGENEVADVADDDLAGIWAALMARLGGIPEYVTLFEAAYPGESFAEMSFAHAANAIAAFEIGAFAADQSPWDRFLRGDAEAMSATALRGAEFFFGRGRCATCHDGPALSDFRAHNTAVPQIGPGKGHGPNGNDDFGFEAISGDPRTRYAFRTPPLRNVELTAPYGHDGAFVTLSSFLAHYRNPREALRRYDPSVLEPALRGTLVPNQEAILRTLDPQLRNVRMDDGDLRDLRAFMAALTDPRSRDLDATIPSRVPSGLPVAD